MVKFLLYLLVLPLVIYAIYSINFINIFKKREELEGKRVEEKNYCIQADLDEIKNKLRRAQKSSNREINIQCRKKN